MFVHLAAILSGFNGCVRNGADQEGTLLLSLLLSIGTN